MLQAKTTKRLNKNNALMLAYLEQVEKAVKRLMKWGLLW